MTVRKLTEADCRNVEWQVVETTDTYRRSVGRGTHPDTGEPIEVLRTEYLAEDALLEQNRQARNETDGQRWGTGLGTERGGNMPIIKMASTPLNKFYADHAARLKDGDQDFMRWWLAQEENQPFRTRRGNL